MNDLIISANNVIQLKWLKLELENFFERSNLVELYYCLRLEFERNMKAWIITMNQRSYIKEVLKRFNMKKMQNGRNLVRCKLKIVKTFG